MKIANDYIKLDSFLKLVNAVTSGGEAKVVIGAGLVRVNGELETRRGRKLRQGDHVQLDAAEFIVGHDFSEINKL